MSISEVEAGIYLGNILAVRAVTALTEANVTHVISVTRTAVVLPSQLQVKRKHIPVEDSPYEDLLCHFDDAYRFINESLNNGGSVLIHCVKGASRSATIVAAFLMRKYQITRVEAIARVREARPVVQPNQGFLAQLDLYENAGFRIHHNTPAYVQWKLIRDSSLAKASRT